MAKRTTKTKEAVRSATIRLPEQMHHTLSVLLAQKRDTLASFMLRAAARYIDEQEGHDAERKHFMDISLAFYRTAAPDVRQWVRESMEAYLTKLQR